MNNYNPDDRCGEPPDGECDQRLSSLEVSFAIPCYVTLDQLKRLHALVDEIVEAPCNQPKEGVHWPAGCGAKPQWSQVDSRLLGLIVDAEAPESGEPTFDNDVYFIETCSRGFVSEEERERKLKRRSFEIEE